MQRLHAAILGGFALIAAPGSARAQMIGPMLYEGPRIALQSHADRVPADPDAPEAMPPTTIDPAALHYTPSPARRAANLAAFVQKTRTADPQGAADLQKLFAEGDFIEKIRAAVAPHGLHVDNVADAYALWWITAWEAQRGNNDTPDAEVLAAVRAQAVRAVGATGELARATDAQKQELAEALWVQSALIDGAVEQAKGNRDRLRQIGAAVAQGARAMGLDLGAIELTPEGFVPLGETGGHP